MSKSIFGASALAFCVAMLTSVANAQDLSAAERQLLLANIVAADGNSDGVLTRGEFEVLINLNAADNLGRAALIVRTGRYATAFARIDANGDGFLTQSELQAMAQEVQG